MDIGAIFRASIRDIAAAELGRAWITAAMEGKLVLYRPGQVAEDHRTVWQ